MTIDYQLCLLIDFMLTSQIIITRRNKLKSNVSTELMMINHHWIISNTWSRTWKYFKTTSCGGFVCQVGPGGSGGVSSPAGTRKWADTVQYWGRPDPWCGSCGVQLMFMTEYLKVGDDWQQQVTSICDVWTNQRNWSDQDVWTHVNEAGGDYYCCCSDHCGNRLPTH